MAVILVPGQVQRFVAPPPTGAWLLTNGRWTDLGVWLDSAVWEDGDAGWILALGVWDDSGNWQDTATWKDSP